MPLTRVAWIGRLTGPKGEIAYRIISQVAAHFPTLKFSIVGGPLAERFSNEAPENVEFSGFVDDVEGVFKASDLVIGAGRVALEAMRHGLPVIAVGESRYIGPVDEHSIALAKETNFGDCDHPRDWDAQELIEDLQQLAEGNISLPVEQYAGYISDYSVERVYPQVMEVYRQALIGASISPFAEIPVLTYHRVLKTPPVNSKFNIYVTVNELEGHILDLKRRKFEFVTFRDIAAGVKVKKPVILTFDDGYRDNFENLLPLLQKHQAKAVIYVLGDRKISNNAWDVEQGEPESPLMTNEEVLACHRSGWVEIGSHGMGHRHLTALGCDEAWGEISLSKQSLESMLNDEVVSFAYPYGDYGDREAELVRKAGYDFGVATVSGPIKMADDLMRVRRIGMFPNTGPAKFRKKTSGWYLRYCKLKGKDF